MENIGHNTQTKIGVCQAKLVIKKADWYNHDSDQSIEVKLFIDGNSAIDNEKFDVNNLRDLVELSKNQEFALNIMPYGQYHNKLPNKINENSNSVTYELECAITDNSAFENESVFKKAYNKFKDFFRRRDPMLEGAHPDMLALREYGAFGFDELSIRFINLPQITKLRFNNDKLFLSKLTTLNLKNNNITSLEHMVSWNIPHNLVRLELSHNLLTDNSIKSLRKCAKPGEKNMFLQVDLTGNFITPMIFQLNYRFNMFDIKCAIGCGLLKYYNTKQYEYALGGVALLQE